MSLGNEASFPAMALALEKWTARFRDDLAEHKAALEVERSSEDYTKPLIALTIETEERIGQMVLWETGEAELNVIDVESEQQSLAESREVSTFFGLQEGLDAIVSVVLGEEKRYPLTGLGA